MIKIHRHWISGKEKIYISIEDVLELIGYKIRGLKTKITKGKNDILPYLKR